MSKRARPPEFSSSPFLMGTEKNLVHFRAWNEGSFALAQEKKQCVFLVLGSASCQISHAIDREIFEDRDLAQQLNETFICLRVDREQRPDLEEICSRTVLAITGRQTTGPLLVFFTPDGEPFFAGPYLPPRTNDKGPGFDSLVNKISELWKTDQTTLKKQAAEIRAFIEKNDKHLSPGSLSDDMIRAACRALLQQFDPSFGGFGKGQKFPNVSALSLLLRRHRQTQDPDLLQAVTTSLDGMMSGALFDQLGGGFAHHCVDQKWLVPSFEKHLSNNARLAELYLEVYQATGHAPYARIARETLDFILREMQSPAGGFFSAIDSESGGENGKYYLWDREQIRKMVPEPMATHLCEYYDVDDDGPFAGKSVLKARRTVKEVGKELGVAEEALLASLEEGRTLLARARGARTAPAIDDKIIASFNGLTMRALARGATILEEQRYLDAAIRAANCLLPLPDCKHQGAPSGLRKKNGHLFRSIRSGEASGTAFLGDYAHLIAGLIAIYEADGSSRYLKESISLAELMFEQFKAGQSGALSLKSTKQAAGTVIMPPLIDYQDGPTERCEATASAAKAIVRLSTHLQRPEWLQRGITLLRSLAQPIKRDPLSYIALLEAADFCLESHQVVVLVGDPEQEAYLAHQREITTRFLPQLVAIHLREQQQEESPSVLTTDCAAGPGQPRFYIWKNSEKREAAPEPASFGAELDASDAELQKSRLHQLGGQILQGRATKEGTLALKSLKRLPPRAYSTSNGLTHCRLGLGSYRIGLDLPQHRQAVSAALKGGINLIDTSPSFALGDSERLIGEVLAKLVNENEITRDNVVLISKVGVALGQEAEKLQALAKRDEAPMFAVPLGNSDTQPPSLAKGAFCLDPSFIRSQLQASRERLGVECIDICLIQSPEHFFTGGKTRDELKQALIAAFRTLEEEVSKGTIGAYGVLSNTLTLNEGSPLHLSLPWLLQIAHESCPQGHHFRFVEAPFSVMDTGVLEKTQKYQGEILSVAEIAERTGVALLSVRPLSPIVGGALLRLVDPPTSEDGASAASLSSARYKVASLESEFETTFAAYLRLSGKVDQKLVLPLSGPLGTSLEAMKTLEQFTWAETTMVTPRLRQLLSQLDRAFAGSNENNWAKFKNRYIQAVGGWLAAIRETATAENRRLLSELAIALPQGQHFTDQLKSDREYRSWASRALYLAQGAEGISGVLVGLRHPSHVEEALSIFDES